MEFVLSDDVKEANDGQMETSSDLVSRVVASRQEEILSSSDTLRPRAEVHSKTEEGKHESEANLQAGRKTWESSTTTDIDEPVGAGGVARKHSSRTSKPMKKHGSSVKGGGVRESPLKSPLEQPAIQSVKRSTFGQSRRHFYGDSSESSTRSRRELPASVSPVRRRVVTKYPPARQVPFFPVQAWLIPAM